MTLAYTPRAGDDGSKGGGMTPITGSSEATNMVEWCEKTDAFWFSDARPTLFLLSRSPTPSTRKEAREAHETCFVQRVYPGRRGGKGTGHPSPIIQNGYQKRPVPVSSWGKQHRRVFPSFHLMDAFRIRLELLSQRTGGSDISKLKS
jgi:hypothetical protein